MHLDTHLRLFRVGSASVEAHRGVGIDTGLLTQVLLLLAVHLAKLHLTLQRLCNTGNSSYNMLIVYLHMRICSNQFVTKRHSFIRLVHSLSTAQSSHKTVLFYDKNNRTPSK